MLVDMDVLPARKAIYYLLGTLMTLQAYQADKFDFIGFPEKHGYSVLEQLFPKHKR